MQKTWEYVEQHGPFLPEPEEVSRLTPEGFRTDMRMDYRSMFTGRIVPSLSGIDKLLTNVCQAKPKYAPCVEKENAHEKTLGKSMDHPGSCL